MNDDINTNTAVDAVPIPMTQQTTKCEGGYCDEHKLAINQLNTLSTLPTAVSRMTGIVSLIAVTFLGIAGIAFNTHLENRRNTAMYNARLDALSVQITEIEKADTRSESRINERLIRIENTLVQLRNNVALNDAIRK